MNDLEECIDSILQQTYYKFEVVIVDDGSCTECAEQLEKIKEKDSRIIVFHKKNEGVSVARNYGFEHSQGEYIVYADGDDVLTPYYFEDGIKNLKENRADIVIGKIMNTTNRTVHDFKPSTRVRKKLLEKMIYSRFANIFSRKKKKTGEKMKMELYLILKDVGHIL